MVPGVIRTVVPTVVGAFFAWLLVNTGIDLGPFTEQFSEVLVVFLTGVWYLLFRWLERNYSSLWGWLLGLASQPIYPDEVEAIEPNAATPKTIRTRLH